VRPPAHAASPTRSDERRDDLHLFNHKLREWEDNYQQPHGPLDGQTPCERLLAKSKVGISSEFQILSCVLSS
jgi:hypothetical protein